MLSRREKELQRRRSHVEALLIWSRRLDEREREISEMENRLHLPKKSKDNIRKHSSRNLAEEFYNERPIISTNHHDYKYLPDRRTIPENSARKQENKYQNYIIENTTSTSDEYRNNFIFSQNKIETVTYERPKYFVDNMHDQRSNNLSGQSKYFVDTSDRKSYLSFGTQRIDAESLDTKTSGHIDLLQDKSNCVDGSYAVNMDTPNLGQKFDVIHNEQDAPIYEIIKQLEIEGEKLSNYENVPNLEMERQSNIRKTDKSVQTARHKKVKGNDLNRLWRHITGSKKKMYSDSQIYRMSKKDLEDFYENAKKEAMIQFSENDDTVLSVFHHSLSDENYDQSNVQITYDSHGDREDIKELGVKTLADFSKDKNITEHIISAFDDLKKNRLKASDENSSRRTVQSDSNKTHSTESVMDEAMYSQSFDQTVKTDVEIVSKDDDVQMHEGPGTNKTSTTISSNIIYNSSARSGSIEESINSQTDNENILSSNRTEIQNSSSSRPKTESSLGVMANSSKTGDKTISTQSRQASSSLHSASNRNTSHSKKTISENIPSVYASPGTSKEAQEIAQTISSSRTNSVVQSSLNFFSRNTNQDSIHTLSNNVSNKSSKKIVDKSTESVISENASNRSNSMQMLESSISMQVHDSDHTITKDIHSENISTNKSTNRSKTESSIPSNKFDTDSKSSAPSKQKSDNTTINTSKQVVSEVIPSPSAQNTISEDGKTISPNADNIDESKTISGKNNSIQEKSNCWSNQNEQIVYCCAAQNSEGNNKQQTKGESSSPPKLTSSSDNLVHMPQEVTLQKLDHILKSDYANSVSSHFASVNKVYEENDDYIKSEASSESLSDSSDNKDTTITDHMESEAVSNKQGSENKSYLSSIGEFLNSLGATFTNFADERIKQITDSVGKKELSKSVEDVSENTEVSFPSSFNARYKKIGRSLDDDLPKLSSAKNHRFDLKIAQDLITHQKMTSTSDKVESDLKKGLLKIDAGLKYLRDTFEKVPVLDKKSDGAISQEYPSDFSSSESEKHSCQSSLRKAQSDPVDKRKERIKKIVKIELENYSNLNFDSTDEIIKYYAEKLMNERGLAFSSRRIVENECEIYSYQNSTKSPKIRKDIEDKLNAPISSEITQKVIDAQNLSPRGKEYKPVFNFEPIEKSKSLTLPIKQQEMMPLNITPIAKDNSCVKPSEAPASVLDQSLNEPGDYQKIEDISGLNFTLNAVDEDDNEVPEEIFWYEDENDASFKDDFKPDATFDLGKAVAYSDISPTQSSPPKETSLVRERVRQIMETRNNQRAPVGTNSENNTGSPRLQDLWITTNENLTPSPGNSPPVSPPSTHLNSEAEELRRKQLEIELEIKRLQQQSEMEFYVREIPNKPPPPYTPPVVKPSVVQPETSQAVAIASQSDEDNLSANSASLSALDIPQPLSRDHIETLIIENTQTLFDAFIDGKMATVEYNSTEPNINEKLVFDLCKEVIIDHFKYTSEVPIWLQGKCKQPYKNVYYNLEDLTEFVSSKVLRFMNLESTTGTVKRRSIRNSESSREVGIERADWKKTDCDYELLCKENVTNCIMNMLLTETADVVSESFRRKNLAAKKS